MKKIAIITLISAIAGCVGTRDSRKMNKYLKETTKHLVTQEWIDSMNKAGTPIRIPKVDYEKGIIYFPSDTIK